MAGGDDQDEAPAEARRSTDLAPPGYRVAGDLVSRSVELEKELRTTRERLKKTERELWATRKVVRRGAARVTTSRAGIGATIGSVVAMAAYGFGLVLQPPLLLGMVVIGFGLGAIVGMRWDPPDDDFPAAPPPRHGGLGG